MELLGSPSLHIHKVLMIVSLVGLDTSGRLPERDQSCFLRMKLQLKTLEAFREQFQNQRHDQMRASSGVHAERRAVSGLSSEKDR